MRKLVLWGYHIDEYRDMFDLSEEDLHLRLLEYACGPSAVNHELHEDTEHVLSCDPLFVLDKATLKTKISLIFENMVEELKQEQKQFDFSRYGGLEAFVSRRRLGLLEFFADYERGRAEKRYVPVLDYHLPYADFSFDMVLSAHYLFADLEEQDVEFHLNVIRELARVGKEVRMFPLVDRHGETSPCLGPVLLGLQQENYGVELREVAYHLHKKGNAMLRVWAQQCPVE